MIFGLYVDNLARRNSYVLGSILFKNGEMLDKYLLFYRSISATL